ncbi:MAG: hypothetical protein HGGPFJEG_00815 [Ignavibacteria bacterium]|nr:hypothetical protein [Ignavibacteria bacterium]
MRISVFEDNSFKNLYPLCLLRGVFDIKIGPYSLIDRIKTFTNKKFELSLICRNYISDYLSEFHKLPANKFSNDDYILLNGKVVFSEKLFDTVISNKGKDIIFYFKDEVIAVCITKKNAANLFSLLNNSEFMVFNSEFLSGFNFKKIYLTDKDDLRIINFPWNVIEFILEGRLNEELNLYLKSVKKFPSVKKSRNFINSKFIFSKTKLDLLQNIVLDASSGSIVISENVEIEPFTFLKGPVFIGKNVKIKSGTKIYGPCVIGESSRVAGEIAESVFHSFVNKQHDGFTGHSYLCPFVNLGADTVTSDLKNNYSEISVTPNSVKINSGMMFLGSIIGDHSKTSINTMLNTGSIIGIFSNLFGSGFHEKSISSFSWNEAGKPFAKYDLSKAIHTAEIVMKRRGVELSKSYEKLISYYFKEL